MAERYKDKLGGYENANKGVFTINKYGKYDIPIIQAVHKIPTREFIGFDKFKNSNRKKGIHFFLDDYAFQKIWVGIDRYTEVLAEFPVVLSPDFSIYNDFPLAVQIFAHYKKHYCGAYWQRKGICVVPTITWSFPNSYEYCFDGEPTNSIVAVSSVGTQNTARGKKMFLQGYEEMEKRLNPQEVLFYGVIPSELQNEKKITDLKIKTAFYNE
jgi:hypothetical protein